MAAGAPLHPLQHPALPPRSSSSPEDPHMTPPTSTTQHAAAPDTLDKTKLLAALVALRKGDFSVRLPLDWSGLDGKIADTFNEVIELNERTAAEHERLSRVVGKEGKITERASIGHVTGSWASSVSFLNTLISDLVH